MIRNKEAMPGEKSKLNLQSQSCRLRFAGHERDVRKTQAPGADQIPTRNAKAHNAAPLSERNVVRSEEHTSELQSLMRISYAVFCLKKKNTYTASRNARPPKCTLESVPNHTAVNTVAH